MDIKKVLKEQIQKALEITIDQNDINIEIPQIKSHGDYSTNIAMQLAKKLKQSPMEIANKIKDKINDTNISKIEVLPPGFINFFLKKDYLLDNINKVLEQQENYGRSNLGQKEKINVEFVSVNPTGIIHLGHARGACYGDCLSRILEFTGYLPTKEYYINDAGVQMDNMAKSIKERYKQLCNMPYQMEENYYYGQEIIDLAKIIYNENNQTYQEKPISYFKQLGLNYFLDKIKEDLALANVYFDVYTSEQKIKDRGLVEECLEKLKNKGYTYEKDGALWLKTTLFSDDKDRVIIKNDKTYTYFLPDIAYHYDKISRGYDKLIDCLGADHYGYINRLKSSIAMLDNDPDKLDVKIIQMVRAMKDNKEYKISKRTGNTITMKDIINEVGKDALRYFFIAKSIDTQIDFDIDLAISKDNNNPIYYIQYAHARICSILNNYQDFEIPKNYKFETINSVEAYNVLEKIYNFKETIETASIKKQPHLIANYVYDLATLFHAFYAKEKIITSDEKYTKERIMLIKSVKITLANALKLIGVDPIEKM